MKDKIQKLMEAKDELERGLAILEKEKGIAVQHACKRIQCGIDLLRIEIIADQLTPFEKEVVTQFAKSDERTIIERARQMGKPMMGIAQMEAIASAVEKVA